MKSATVAADLTCVCVCVRSQVYTASGHLDLVTDEEEGPFLLSGRCWRLIVPPILRTHTHIMFFLFYGLIIYIQI